MQFHHHIVLQGAKGLIITIHYTEEEEKGLAITVLHSSLDRLVVYSSFASETVA